MKKREKLSVVWFVRKQILSWYFLSNLQLNMNNKTRNSWKNSVTENIHTHLYVNFEEAPFAEAKYLSIWFNLDIYQYACSFL